MKILAALIFLVPFVGKGLTHIGIVSDLRSTQGTPLVIHNIGRGAQEEDILFKYTVTGRYRIKEQTNRNR